MKVLVATDGSEPACRACELAAQMLHRGDEVRILSVLSYTEYPYTLYPGEHLSDEVAREKKVTEDVEATTGRARDIFEKAGFTPEIAHRFGHPPDEIVAEIDGWRPDLVVLGRRGVHGIERILGSVSEHVVRRTGTAILLVP